jgi:hypothetical protein
MFLGGRTEREGGEERETALKIRKASAFFS